MAALEQFKSSNHRDRTVNDIILASSLNNDRVGTVKSIPGKQFVQPPSASDTQKESDISKQIESYASFEVTSSLIFGFAVSILFGNIQSDAFKDSYPLEIIFSSLMGLVLISNAYTMVVMSLTHFHVNRYLADGKYKMAETYLSMYHSYRSRARNAFRGGLIFFLIAIIIYLYPQLRIISMIVTSSILGIGIILILFTTYTMINPQKFVDEESIGQLSLSKMFRK